MAKVEAAEQGFAECARLEAGLLRCGTIPPWELLPRLRCSYGALIDCGTGPTLDLERQQETAATIRTLIAHSPVLTTIRDWLAVEEGPIRYRFSLSGGKLRREALHTILEGVRAACVPLGLVDSPSNYDLEMVVQSGKRGSRLVIRPSFMGDTRFAYRRKDVGAAINPVVAACLARMVRTSAHATVFDPTCGSGTLLIERGMLDATTHLRGLDISPTAIDAARTNVKAAEFGRKVQIVRGDASEAGAWQACDEVIANLPWGMRTKHADADLPRLYQAIPAHLATHLQPGGRAVLYSANTQLLDAGLRAQQRRLRIVEKHRVFSGGLWSTIWIIAPRA